VGFAAVSLVNFGLYVLRWKLIADHMQNGDGPISYGAMYLHRMAGYCFSYIIPSAQTGGEPVRIALLAKDGVRAERATAGVTLDIAFEVTFLAGFIFLGFILSLLQGVTDFSTNYVSFLFIILFFGFFLTLWFLVWKGYRPFEQLEKRQRKNHPWSKTLHFLAETERTIIDFFVQQRRVTVWIMGLSVLTMLFRIVEVYFIAWGFGFSGIQFSQAFLAATLPGIAMIVPIPAGIGVLEGSMDFIFSTLAIPINALAFVAILRARDLLFVIIGLVHTLIATRGSLFSFLKEAKYDKE
jgi:uncharacterized protein (TIRG00374 family)